MTIKKSDVCQGVRFALSDQVFDLFWNVRVLHDTGKVFCSRAVCEYRNDIPCVVSCAENMLGISSVAAVADAVSVSLSADFRPDMLLHIRSLCVCLLPMLFLRQRNRSCNCLRIMSRKGRLPKPFQIRSPHLQYKVKW